MASAPAATADPTDAAAATPVGVWAVWQNGTAIVSWLPPTLPTNFNITEFHVYRGVLGGGPPELVGTTAESWFSEPVLLEGVMDAFYYQVAAFDGAAESPPSGPAILTGAGCIGIGPWDWPPWVGVDPWCICPSPATWPPWLIHPCKVIRDHVHIPELAILG